MEDPPENRPVSSVCAGSVLSLLAYAVKVAAVAPGITFVFLMWQEEGGDFAEACRPQAPGRVAGTVRICKRGSLIQHMWQVAPASAHLCSGFGARGFE